MSLTEPVIGVGVPAAAYLPMAFRRPNTECILLERFSVACTVGAVVGMVDIVLTGEITPTDSKNIHCVHWREKKYLTCSGRLLTVEDFCLKGLPDIKCLRIMSLNL